MQSLAIRDAKIRFREGNAVATLAITGEKRYNMGRICWKTVVTCTKDMQKYNADIN